MAGGNARHQTILDEIADDLSGEPNFPTCLDAALLVRDTLKDPEAPLTRVTQVLSLEPLISTRLLRLANSVNQNPSGRPIADLSAAVGRLGFEAVRTVSLAVALDQMMKLPGTSVFSPLARATWDNALQVSAISRVLARRLGRINPDAAMLAGLVCNIGVFYLLFRASDYPSYREDQASTVDLIQNEQRMVGENLLQALGLPPQIIAAVSQPQRPAILEQPGDLNGVLYLAEMLAENTPPWLAQRLGNDESLVLEADRALFAHLIAEASDDINETRAILGG
jgi:HD-like signal output (HDOD) protein